MKKLLTIMALAAAVVTGCGEKDEDVNNSITLGASSKTLFAFDEYQIDADSKNQLVTSRKILTTRVFQIRDLLRLCMLGQPT